MNVRKDKTKDSNKINSTVKSSTKANVPQQQQQTKITTTTKTSSAKLDRGRNSSLVKQEEVDSEDVFAEDAPPMSPKDKVLQDMKTSRPIYRPGVEKWTQQVTRLGSQSSMGGISGGGRKQGYGGNSNMSRSASTDSFSSSSGYTRSGPSSSGSSGNRPGFTRSNTTTVTTYSKVIEDEEDEVPKPRLNKVYTMSQSSDYDDPQETVRIYNYMFIV